MGNLPHEVQVSIKYPIKEEFKFFRSFRPPFHGAVFRLALLMPKNIRPTENLAAVKRRAVGRDGKPIRLYVFSPKSAEGRLPAFLFFHGGGFVYRGAPYHYRLAKIYAERANAAAVFVDYRPAFQGEFGMTLADCVSAYRFVLENADEWNLDIGNIGFAGDSAGGYLSLAVIKECALNAIPLPKYQILVYPVVDPRMTSDSMQRFRDTPMWNGNLNEKMWRIYRRGNAVYNPLDDDLSFMPQTYVETAEYDCLSDEGEMLYNRLRNCGVPCLLNKTAGTMHGFDICLSAPTTRRAIDGRVCAMRNFISGGSLDPALP